MYYVAKLTPETVGGYSVTFPDIPGCITQGDTLEEALAMAKEALELTLEVYLDGRMLPDPDTAEDRATGLYAIEVNQELAGRLIDRARQDGCGQPCIMFVEEEDEKGRESSNDD